MAYIGQNNKLLENGEDPNQQAQTQQQASAPASTGIGGNIVSGGPTGPAGGAGGQGSWTNIQSYLKANHGNNSSADVLTKTTSDAFNTDRSNAQNQANQVKDTAKQQVEQNNLGMDKASQLVQQASQNYNYGGQQSDAYNQGVNQVKNTLSAQYNAPMDFSYGLSNNSQQYGNLNTNDGYQGIMNKLYNKAAGGHMTQGQLALQNQLDVGNEALNNARQNAVADYGKLNQDIGNVVQNTTNDLSGYQNQFLQNQNALRDYLINQSNEAMTGKSQAEADARKSYNELLNSPGSGLNSFLYNMDGRNYTSLDTPIDTYSAGRNESNNDVVNFDRDRYGVHGRNLSYGDLQKEYDALNGGDIDYVRNLQNSLRSEGPYRADTGREYDLNNYFNNYFTDVKGALDKFYGQQKDAFSNTGDAEKRQYNTIADILGLDGKMKQGFNILK